jgi:Transglutaminase-like superfamily
MDNYLKATNYLDYNQPSIQFFCAEIELILNTTEKAVALYNKVRDHFQYNPYHLDLRKEKLQASAIVGKRKAWCVEKAIIFASCARYMGIPAKLGFAIVTNHIGVEKLKKYLLRDEIVFHGYVSVFLNDNWVKCTPAFDPRLCKFSGVPLLEWDGKNDAMFQAFSGDQKFMEYIHHYGEFDDVPQELMQNEMKKYYPHLFKKPINTAEFSFAFEGMHD